MQREVIDKQDMEKVRQVKVNSRLLPVSKQNASIIPTGLSEPISKSLPRAIQRIIEQLNPQKIILFGSYAYGLPMPDSDVDLLIILETNASTKERYLTVSNLLYPRSFPVDILVKTPQEISSALQQGDFFIKELLTRGHLLYERRH